MSFPVYICSDYFFCLFSLPRSCHVLADVLPKVPTSLPILIRPLHRFPKTSSPHDIVHQPFYKHSIHTFLANSSCTLILERSHVMYDEMMSFDTVIQFNIQWFIAERINVSTEYRTSPWNPQIHFHTATPKQTSILTSSWWTAQPGLRGPRKQFKARSVAVTE